MDLKIDPDGGHYASEFTSIPKGTYEGQLVIGDSFMHPVKKFTIEKDNDIVVLQFEVQGSAAQASGGGQLPVIAKALGALLKIFHVRFGQQQL